MSATQKLPASGSTWRLSPGLFQLVTVSAVDNAVKAEIIQNALHAEGIRCFLDDEHQAGGLAAVDVKIQVPIADADRARKLIESHDRPAGE